MAYEQKDSERIVQAAKALEQGKALQEANERLWKSAGAADPRGQALSGGGGEGIVRSAELNALWIARGEVSGLSCRTLAEQAECEPSSPTLREHLNNQVIALELQILGCKDRLTSLPNTLLDMRLDAIYRVLQ